MDWRFQWSQYSIATQHAGGETRICCMDRFKRSPLALWWLSGQQYSERFGSITDGCSDRLNDLWEYDYRSNNWTLRGGNFSAIYDSGRYVAIGQPGYPCNRENAAAWKDNRGLFYLFGGTTSYNPG